jgi:hypothetical protein
MTLRIYMAPPDEGRCAADRKPLSDGSLARCMRRATVGNLRAQHARMTAAFRCEYCGGNDELPPDHCLDCGRPQVKA